MMNNQFSIGNCKIGKGNRPFIIAEMACAHNGDKKQAFQLIEAAVNANADAIQLQFFKADETVTPHHPVYDVVKKIEFSESDWKDIFNYARSEKILVFACTYDVASVHLAAKLGVDGIKLNSADLSNPEVVIAVAQTGIPFTLGTGASTLEEIKSGLMRAQKSGASKIILMHGVQNFPTKTEDLNISRLALLMENFEIPIGYHDHTDGDDIFANYVDLIAVGAGANVIEKHITLSRIQKGIDYQAALEPEEFKEFVKTIHRAWIAMGKKEIGEFSESDIKYRIFQKKSIVAASNLKAGETITRDKVLFIRNEIPGMPPVEFEKIINKKLKSDVSKYSNINPGEIE